MSDGAACASAFNSFDSVWRTLVRFDDDEDAASVLATFAPRSARSWQFFVLAKLGTEPELLEVVAPELVVGVLADGVVPGVRFLLPPPQPAARATSPATNSAAATCFDLGSTVMPIVNLSLGAA